MNRPAFLALSFLTWALTTPVHAVELAPSSLYLQGGVGQGELSSVSVGVVWPWDWKSKAWGGEFSANTDGQVSFWRADAFGGGHQNFTQFALVPYLRYRFDQGSSPWFVEAGIGISVTDKLYVTPGKSFSTRFNFSDNIAVGRNFGAGNRHELSLRLQHISNASIKRPNPGEEFVQLRYAISF